MFRKIIVLFLLSIVLISCSNPSYTAMDYADMGYLVSTGSTTLNMNSLFDFDSDVKAKTPSEFKRIQYTKEMNPILIEVSFDGINFNYLSDSTLVTSGEREKIKDTCEKYEVLLDFQPNKDSFHGTYFTLKECTSGIDRYLYTLDSKE